ncbi:T9SS type A sorting domain-containing protein [Pedobacter sp. Du54]|uniref:T9SS type A sorting domain-containing protein n=1 Tax=Pedobacter anseongensis TaxID=3133439 RepID=UPI003095022B
MFKNLKIYILGMLCALTLVFPQFAKAQGLNQSIVTTGPYATTYYFTNTDFDLSPIIYASSGLPIIYSSNNPAVATIVGNKIHQVSVGSFVLTMSQPGNATYNAAPDLVVTITLVKGFQNISFPEMPAKSISDADFDPGAVSNGGLAITYTSSNPAVATIVAGKVHIVGLGTSNITASQPGDANYNAAPSEIRLLSVSPNAQTITFAPINKVYLDPVFVPSASASSNLPITYYTSSNPAVATVFNSTSIRIVGVGTSTITAFQNGSPIYQAASASTTLTVGKANQNIFLSSTATKSFNNPDYDPLGSASSTLPVTYASSNAAVATIVANKIHITGVGTTTITASQIGDANYNAAIDVTQSLTITKADQIITFPDMASKPLGSPDFDPGATVSSGLPAVYTSSNPAVATIVANKVHVVGLGTTTITAAQPGDANNNAATSVSKTLTISGLGQVINFPPILPKLVGDADFDPNATASSGLPVTYSSSNTAVATVVGSLIHITGAGTVTITANQLGDSNYAGASASATFTVSKRDQTITFDPIPTKLRSDADFSPVASSTSGLPITYSSGNPAVAIIVGNTIRLVGAGTAVISANQSGDASFNAAPAVTQTLTVNKGIQVITFPIIAPKNPADVDFDPGSTSNSGLQTVYTSSNPAVATIVGRLVHIVGIGTTQITATQAGDANYEPASLSRTLNVAALEQVINFPAIPNAATGDADFDPGATVNSPLAIVYTSSNPAVATIVAGKIHVVGVGTTSITASQPGNGVYAAAVSRIRPLTVTKNIQTITFPILPTKTIGDADFATGATINSPLAIVYTSSNPAVATVTGGIVHIVGTGTTTITAAQPGDGTYEPATSVSRVLTVNGSAVQTVAISPIPDKPFGTSDFSPVAVTTSGLGIVFSSSNPAVATIANNQVHIVGIGVTTITATQPGDANFAAASASTSMTVIKGTPTIFFSGIPNKIVNNPDFDLFASTTAGLTITYSSSDPSVATIVNGKVHLVGVGTAIITASQPGNANYNASTASQTLTVDKGIQFITFPTIPQTSPSTADFDPGATVSSGLPITYTSSDPSVATIVAGKIHVVGLGSTSITASQPGNANYLAATDIVRTLTIGKGFQTIIFPLIPAKILGTADFDPGATVASGLPITYTSSNPAVATIVAGQIHIVGLGSTIITASQVGDINFNPATDVARVFNVSANPQVITFASSISKVFGSADFTPEASASSGLELTFTSSNPAVASIIENRVRINKVGTSIITATQIGNSSFAGATAVSTLTVTKADQTITFPVIPNKQRNDPDFAIGATASSGLTVFYTSSNPSVGVVIGNRLQIVGMGSTVITASQPGDTNFNPSLNAFQTVTVVKGAQIISFPDLPVKALTDVDFDPGATVNTGFTVTYLSSNTNVATIVDGKIHIVGLGNSTITASVAGTADYDAALNVSKVLTVKGLSQTLIFGAIADKKPSDADFNPGATVNTGLPIVYTSSDLSVATIVAGKIHIVGVGTTTITATQAGDGTYASATASVTLTVAKATQNITFPAIANKSVGDADFDPLATSSSGLAIVYTSSNPAVATIVANKVHIVGIGTTTITATQAGTIDVAPATASVNLTITQTAQTINFPAIAAKDITTVDFDPGATASSGLAVSYSSSNTAVATIVAGKIHIVGAGTSTITATQVGNATFGVAAPVSVQLTVNKGNQTITFPTLTLKAPTDADFDPLATASSGLTISYSSSNTAVATIVAGKIHIVGSGSSVITASQAGNTNYNAAAEVTQTLDVVYTLPVSNFNVKATDETCKASNNGAINIQAVQALNYTASVTVNGGTTTYPFSTVLAINNLQAGSYNVCIAVAGQPNYKQCFDLVIKEPKDLAVFSSIKDNGNSVLLTLEGSDSYRIDVNGQIITTNKQEVLVPLIKGNNIVKISSDLNCQGVITKTFLTNNVISLYPNPVKNVLNITTGSNESNTVKVEIHALDGRLVHSSLQKSEYGQVAVDLSKLNKGLYVLTLTVGNSKTVHKILKD